MAEGLIARGWTVCGCARSKTSVEELSAQFPSPHQFSAVDVSDNTAVEAWVQSATALHGAPDLLINNAAVINHPCPLWEVAHDDFSKVIDVNIKGSFHLIRHAVPQMIARGEGIIVNFSSGWGRSTSPEVAPYCASKFAIEGLSSALAQELPEGLACVAANPGVIDTDMLRTSWGEAASAYQGVEAWSKSAIPFLENLTVSDNGKSLSIT